MDRSGWIKSWMTRGGIVIVHVSFFNVAVPLRRRRSFGASFCRLKFMADFADFDDKKFLGGAANILSVHEVMLRKG